MWPGWRWPVMSVPHRLKFDGSSQKPASMRRGVHAGLNILSGGVLWQAARKDRARIIKSGERRIVNFRFIGVRLRASHGEVEPGFRKKHGAGSDAGIRQKQAETRS
jgi:hypothetical protein